MKAKQKKKNSHIVATVTSMEFVPSKLAQASTAQTVPPASPLVTLAKKAQGFDLNQFEAMAYAGQNEDAAQQFFALLRILDKNYGDAGEGFSANMTANLHGQAADAHVVNRICSALSTLLANPKFKFSSEGGRQLFQYHRWISSLFAVSAFRNADHILRALNLHSLDNSQSLTQDQVIKFCLLYTANAEVPIDMEVLWSKDRGLAISLAVSLLSSRFMGTDSAHRKREVLLPWLSARLQLIDDLDQLPQGVLHDVYMACSYADLPSKHAVKGAINHLVRKKLKVRQIEDVLSAPVNDGADKPLMMVVLEWFFGQHSIYRTHSASLKAAREKFRLIGVGMAEHVDAKGRETFDKFIDIQGDAIQFVRDTAALLRPKLVYYPAFGMFPSSIYLTNLRLAPVQVVSYGHPATSMSPVIDHFVLPEDWVGDPRCFSENLITLPKAAMPFVPSAGHVDIVSKLRESPETIYIAVAATPMKFNPRFIKTLGRIKRESPRPVCFHFFIGMARWLLYLEVCQFIRSHLDDVVIYKHLTYPDYLAKLNECDMYVNPFPFGNTNGIVDVSAIGLVGVCKTGREVLEHIDEALFRRLGLPDWLIAKDEDTYVAAALRLIGNDQERLALRRQLLAEKRVDWLYQGEPAQFGEALAKLCTGK